MNDDLDQPFKRRFYDRKDQRENGDDLTARFRACGTLREMGLLAHRTYRVPLDRVQAIWHQNSTRGIRAMNLAREARRWRLTPRQTSLGRVQSNPAPARVRPWEVG